MTGADIAVVIPVFNDGESLNKLLEGIAVNFPTGTRLHVTVVDDGSVDQVDVKSPHGSTVQSIHIVTLGSNLGHQRAIAVGLAHVASQAMSVPTLVMDSDGEDRPECLKELWTAHHQSPYSVIVAERRRRNETVNFKALYSLFRVAFRVLTGRRLDFGNFVLLSSDSVQRLVYMNELWNHFPAAVMRSRLPIIRVPIDRGVRYSGTSRMNFTALVNHGLAAIAAFIDTVFVRLLIATGALLGLFSLAGIAVVFVRLWSSWGVPGWANTALGLIVLGLLQLVGLLVVVTFLTLSTRSNSSPPPISFARQFVARIEKMP